MKCYVNTRRRIVQRNKMIYGHFIEHFHRQIYDGIFDPENPLSDEQGLRGDVLQAMRHIEVPVLRWPGGCFVSAYHWKDAVGKNRIPRFDKAWRVEDPNLFGTDEFIDLCNKLECEPYICTNAGTGTPEEMSDWVEYCNLEHEGQYAKMRISNGHERPFGVKYWGIGNESYATWEMGAKHVGEWGHYVNEAAKMIQNVDPSVELSASALGDVDWDLELLKKSSGRLKWLSIHQYWDELQQSNDFADYTQCMGYTQTLTDTIDRVRGTLASVGLENKICIAFDEWNLRGWHHPNSHSVSGGLRKEDYLYPRDQNDDNTKYSVADVIFTACFFNTCHRNADLVQMANFAPIVNTRGCIFTYKDGIVLRGTYHVFDMYVHYMGDTVIDSWCEHAPKMRVDGSGTSPSEIDALDVVASTNSEGILSIAVVNKDPKESHRLSFVFEPGYHPASYRICTVTGSSTESYNDVGVDGIKMNVSEWRPTSGSAEYEFQPHSANILLIDTTRN